jgi:hypothetical protein
MSNEETIEYRLGRIEQDLQRLNDKLDNRYVSHDVFDIRVGRLEKIAFGLIAVVLTGIIVAGLSLIII